MKRKPDFFNLFIDFVQSYLYKSGKKSFVDNYNRQRKQSEKDFKKISEAVTSQTDIPEALLLKLLHLRKEANNVLSEEEGLRGLAPNTQQRKKEGVDETKAQNMRKLAKSIVDFIVTCSNNPSQLSEAYQKLSKSPYFDILNTQKLTSILNALKPNNFLLINKNTLKVITYFADVISTSNLTDYPKINIAWLNLIEELYQNMPPECSGFVNSQCHKLFPIFCEWLIKKKEYDFSEGFQQLQLDIFNQYSEDEDIEEINLEPEYTLAQCAKDTGFEEKELNFWLQALERKKQIIFYGPPGTGKTYIANKLAKHLIGGGDGIMHIVQFHPAYAYEDFVQGIRPQRKNGELGYPLVDGRFLEFCNKARNCANTCVLIIDEINRANLARVFGELMYLLEYRDEEEISLASSEPFSITQKISLASGKLFIIPGHVRIIGTMNTADRSIALVDHALRRRFAFIHLKPNYEILSDYHASSNFVKKLIEKLKQLNAEIANPHYEIGISFFMRGDITEQIESIWKLEIEPYLEQYFFDQPSKVDQFRWKEIKKQVFPGEETEKQVFP